MLAAICANGSAVGRRLLVQGNYSNPNRTEQLHLETEVSVVVSKVLYDLTYFAEADKLNTIFGMWVKITRVDFDTYSAKKKYIFGFVSKKTTFSPSRFIQPLITNLFRRPIPPMPKPRISLKGDSIVHTPAELGEPVRKRDWKVSTSADFVDFETCQVPLLALFLRAA